MLRRPIGGVYQCGKPRCPRAPLRKAPLSNRSCRWWAFHYGRQQSIQHGARSKAELSAGVACSWQISRSERIDSCRSRQTSFPRCRQTSRRYWARADRRPLQACDCRRTTSVAGEAYCRVLETHTAQLIPVDRSRDERVLPRPCMRLDAAGRAPKMANPYSGTPYRQACRCQNPTNDATAQDGSDQG